MKPLLAFAVASLVLVAACGDAKLESGKKVRIGHFPNVTHAQGLLGHATTREGKGRFEEALGKDVAVEWYVYNAGPSAMEALLAGSLDATYVGPGPALNAYVKSKGDEIRVIAGAATGGAALVVQGDSPIKAPADFRGKTIATPQLGNTQDIACRSWLAEQGFKITQTGGDVTVLPTDNPLQLPLFVDKKIDAAWTVEPWVARLEKDGKGRVFLEEKDAVTTVLVASAKFVRESPDLAARLLKAHEETTAWIVANEKDAKAMVKAEILAETRKEMADDLLALAWPRLRFETAISVDVFADFLKKSQAAGFLKDAGDLSRLVATPK